MENNKSLSISKKAWKLLKEYCLENDKKMTSAGSELIIKSVEDWKNEK